jgi:hypothetical protein
MRYLAILLAAAASLSACSSGSSGTGTETGEPRPDESLITAEEIAEVRTAHNAYDAVRTLRPQWLTARPSRSTIDPQPVVPTVFLDRMELGPLATLGTVAVVEVQEIRYFDAGQAMNRFGRQYNMGIIQIITR